MAKGKYGKYISKLQPTGIKHPEYNKKIREPLLFNEASYPGAKIQAVTQLICESGCGWGLGFTLVNPPGLDVKDEPHTHEFDEVWRTIRGRCPGGRGALPGILQECQETLLLDTYCRWPSSATSLH
jgi:hypothetical protein